MNLKKSENNSLEPDINYNLPKVIKRTLPLFGLLFLIIGFMLNFQTISTIKSIINSNLSVNKNCKLSINDIDIKYLSLGFSFKNISSSSRCHDSIKSIKSIFLGFRGISFSPLGLRLSFNIDLSKIKNIHIISSLGFSEFKLVLNEQRLKLKEIIKMTNSPIDLSGNLIIDGVISGDYNKIKGSNISISSDSIEVPAQDIGGFLIPRLDLHENSLKLDTKNSGSLRIRSLSIGSKKDILQILAQGEIKKFTNFARAILSFEGKFNLKKELNQKIPLLNLLLDKKKKSQGYYQFELNGRMSKPNFNVK